MGLGCWFPASGVAFFLWFCPPYPLFGSLQRSLAFRTHRTVPQTPGCIQAHKCLQSQVRSCDLPQDPIICKSGWPGGSGDLGKRFEGRHRVKTRGLWGASSGLSFSHIDARDQRWAAQERPRAQSNPRQGQDPHLSPAGRAPTLQHPPHRAPSRPSSGSRDCRHSPHGCCPDGHTPSLGPQWQGCPLAGASCLQSR